LEISTLINPDWLSNIIIRPVREEDLPALEWDGEYTHFRKIYAQAYERSRQGTLLMWIAELIGTGIIGQVFIQLDCDRPEMANGTTRAYLYSFRIRSAFRNAGLGTQILDFVCKDLYKRGFLFVTLNVAKTNVRAKSLYERHGFHVVAPESGVWSYTDNEGKLQEVEEPAWRMEKHLKHY
jgi:ribosomal protein S18 acetylase RimI-like enzyme